MAKLPDHFTEDQDKFFGTLVPIITLAARLNKLPPEHAIDVISFTMGLLINVSAARRTPAASKAAVLMHIDFGIADHQKYMRGDALDRRVKS